jgi:ATP-dependent Lhr-like helicase
MQPEIAAAAAADPLAAFHPAVAAWFRRSFAAPTVAQVRAWEALHGARHVLVAAPTGSGKTFAAFLAAIDALVREGLEQGLPDETRVLYVSPLKALSNDIQRNLDGPLKGIRDELRAAANPEVEIRALVRSGDTSAAERVGMRRRSPHIIVTTPESLYILLTSESGRRMLAHVRTVIVDEIHAIAGNKRGTHLALSLERLEALLSQPLRRIGLSATQKPLEDIARFLLGCGPGAAPGCTIVDQGHLRKLDLAVELPSSPLAPVMSGDVWTEVYDRLAGLIEAHRTTLVFVNTRRLVERVARHLSERLGEAGVAAHHGSLSKERRLDAEQRLKRGELKVLVATASLELGIDVGEIDLVCQIGSTRSIGALLQRVGRAGHAVGGTSKGRLFPLSRDELVECVALVDAVRRGELDRLVIPENALDVLAQQLVAEVANGEWSITGLFALVRRAHPFRNLPEPDFAACIDMLADGFDTRHGRRGALLHRDAINGVVRPRKAARLTALTSGGAIPDNADYRVVLEPAALLVGTVNEDFAVESLQGDVFQLGNISYRILRVERGTVRVEDAHGQAPSIPFWLGEAPGRSIELSAAVARLKAQIEQGLGPAGEPDEASAAYRWLRETVGLDAPAAEQLLQYLGAGLAALGVLPTLETIVFERFFDESGGTQLVIHSPFGSRINRAWGLALRKRFCRNFNFELQAAATEDHIVLSLTHAHSFDLAEVARYLHSNSVRDVLVQALCTAPMFGVRWRWVAGIALALPRFRGGKKVPPQIARMNAEDLLAAIFPDQVACAENRAGAIEIPEHPLVTQTIRDCLGEAMDLPALESLLRGLESGAIRVVTRDVTQPSPLALEALTARPYAYLDDAPLEERRTQAVMARTWLDRAAAADIGRLDPEAIARVRAEAWPDAATADELHDALTWMGFMTEHEAGCRADWPALLAGLESDRRVLRMPTGDGAGRLWVAAERRAWFEPQVPASETALVEILRGRLEALGPVRVAELAAPLGISPARADAALVVLQTEGFAMRGEFTSATAPGVAAPRVAAPAVATAEWCERRLRARIHRYTVKRLRAEIEPVPVRDFLRFLFVWQRVQAAARLQGAEAVAAVLTQLEGFEAPAVAWETEILPTRLAEYEPDWLDDQGRAGRTVWTRLAARGGDPDRGASPVRATPIVMLARRQVAHWSALTNALEPRHLSSRAQAVVEALGAHGASFFEEIAEQTRLLPAEAEGALAELVAVGLVNSDGFAGLRALLAPREQRAHAGGGSRRKRRRSLLQMADAGRWALVRKPLASLASLAGAREAAVETVVRSLLRRWGVIFWKLLAREADWLPPWRELLQCCRRLEARGEIRGGRFVAGFSGEQFALPEAIGALRDARRDENTRDYVAVSAADPLNLIGILTPGPRLASVTANRVLYRDGIPVATQAAGEVQILVPVAAADEWELRTHLVQRHVPAALAEMA